MKTSKTMLCASPAIARAGRGCSHDQKMKAAADYAMSDTTKCPVCSLLMPVTVAKGVIRKHYIKGMLCHGSGLKIRAGKNYKLQHGSYNSNAKLDEHDVSLIRELVAERERRIAHAAELSDRNIAEKFGVTVHAIRKIKAGLTWKTD